MLLLVKSSSITAIINNLVLNWNEMTNEAESHRPHVTRASVRFFGEPAWDFKSIRKVAEVVVQGSDWACSSTFSHNEACGSAPDASFGSGPRVGSRGSRKNSIRLR
jgi:hypothetical protein